MSDIVKAVIEIPKTEEEIKRRSGMRRGTMQIVINIPENTYDQIVEGGTKRHFVYKLDLMRAILEGTPLPKGHGRLIDADSLLEYGSCPNSCDGTATCMESHEHLHCPIRVFDTESINDTPTIIEADKEA